MKTLVKSTSLATHVECPACGKHYSITQRQTFATCCNQPLTVQYNLSGGVSRERLPKRINSMWRYAEMLPVFDRGNVVSLGEGMTPVLPLPRLAAQHGFDALFMKDESGNPTGSFKARGISMAISKAKELGINSCIVPTAGNAGGALAAYCASAGMACTVVMPRHTPEVFKQECELYGAELVLVDGLISDCAKKVEALKASRPLFDMSTLKEPYRLEGKKTMGYEIAEQGGWQLPDYILYPTGGGTGLIGIWKAFKEMQALGWISGPLPKMIAIQSDRCNPVQRSLGDPLYWKTAFEPQPTLANGLAVPYPFGLTMMQHVLAQSGGTAFAVSDTEIIQGVREIARTEGLLVSPEGAAVWQGLLHLRNLGVIPPHSNILLLNTGSGYKYLQNIV